MAMSVTFMNIVTNVIAVTIVTIVMVVIVVETRLTTVILVTTVTVLTCVTVHCKNRIVKITNALISTVARMQIII